MPLMAGCGLFKPTTATVELEPLDVEETKILPYQPTTQRKFDLLHMNLEISLDWENRRVPGKATLQLTPYFYATDSLLLDAKGFDLHSLEIVKDSNSVPLKYDYDGNIIAIQLPQRYSKSDTITIEVNYTAKPDEREVSGGKAIISDKGLFFINPDNSAPNKPQQVWTQGETSFNSCWFPTIDHPNERLTHDIYLTVHQKFTTLSNGVKMFSVEVDDSLRTDYWKMDQPHAPYLVMIGVGEFSVVEDSLADLPVNYYVEQEYEQYAQDIFGNTPEMIKFYSDILGVPYPWKKYSQIVVRDYVSGAMENTTAVVHGEFLQRTKRELLDETNEDVIAHELFHHWFGDLVTCESWSNIAMNESFATYGEFLWDEYKYGSHIAEFNARNHLQDYLAESFQKKEKIIRHHYAIPDDLFDAHSYSKGGRILHLLRTYIGDEAFFKSLNYYLTEHQFQSVEIHDFRLACEKVTGMDLNWFFDQWFFTEGHPNLEVSYQYGTDSTNTVSLNVKQTQAMNGEAVFQLPLKVDFYFEDKVETKEIRIDKNVQSFHFELDEHIMAVNFDADKALVGTIAEKKPNAHEWLVIFQRGKRYLDKRQALYHLSEMSDEDAETLVRLSLKEEMWALRVLGIRYLDKVPDEEFKKTILSEFIENDPNSYVRYYAVEKLLTLVEENDKKQIIKTALADSSNRVMSLGISSYAQLNPEECLALADSLISLNNQTLKLAIANLYGEHGTWKNFDYFESLHAELSSYDAYEFQEYLTNFLIRSPYNEKVYVGINMLKEMAINGEYWWIRNTARASLQAIGTEYKKNKPNDENHEEVVEAIDKILESLKS